MSNCSSTLLFYKVTKKRNEGQKIVKNRFYKKVKSKNKSSHTNHVRNLLT